MVIRATHASDESARIFVRTLTGKTIMLIAQQGTTVEELKQMIQNKGGWWSARVAGG